MSQLNNGLNRIVSVVLRYVSGSLLLHTSKVLISCFGLRFGVVRRMVNQSINQWCTEIHLCELSDKRKAKFVY